MLLERMADSDLDNDDHGKVSKVVVLLHDSRKWEHAYIFIGEINSA